MWGMINLLATAAAFLWGTPWLRGEKARVFRYIRRAALATGLGIMVLSVAYPDAFLSRLGVYEETLMPNSPTNELAHRGWEYPVKNFLAAFDYPRWTYGYGIGTTSLGTQYVARIFGAERVSAGVESGYGALVVEMGIVGLILWVITTLAISLSAWRVVKNLKGSPLFPLGFVIFWYAFVLLFPVTFGGIQAYEDFLLNAYLWLLLGLLFRLPTVPLSAQPAVAARSQLQHRWIT
jgi:hypothetical protein